MTKEEAIIWLYSQVPFMALRATSSVETRFAQGSFAQTFNQLISELNAAMQTNRTFYGKSISESLCYVSVDYDKPSSSYGAVIMYDKFALKTTSDIKVSKKKTRV